MMGVVGLVASCDPTRRSRARPAVGPTTPRSRRGTRGPQARCQPPRPWRLDCPRPDDRPQLGPSADQPDRRRTLLPPQTVRERIKRFNAEGLDGLGDRPGAGRKPRLTEHQRSQLIALVEQPPPGRLRRQADGSLHADQPEKAPTGPWTPSPRPPRRSVSGCSAARSAASCWPRGPPAPVALLGPVQRPGVRRKPTAIVALYTRPPARATVVCADELGPVTPRTFPPAPAWTPDGHRVTAPLEDGRGVEKAWVYGGLRVADGQAVTCTAASRNSVNYQRFLELVEAANPAGDILVITDNLSSHTSVATRTWLADHPRIRQVFIPKGACWLNLQEAWWRLFRRQALAGQCFADAAEITLATRVATCQLNQRARPWV